MRRELAPGLDDETTKSDASRQEGKRKKKSSLQRTQGDGIKESENVHFPGPPTMHLDLNIVLVILVGLSFGTRLWRLTSIHYIVFDELHLGQFTNFFMNNKYFFDPNPPLGKLLYAATAYIIGYDGQFSFDDIGQDFGNYVDNMWVLRAVAASLGSLVVPMVYGITFELSNSHWAAAMGAFLVTFDNMFVITSKFVLFDPPLLFFTAASVFSFLKFHKLANSPFTWSWWVWLAILGLSLLGVTSVKYVGFLTVISVGFLVGCDFWKILGDGTVSSRNVSIHAVARGALLFLVPALLYLLQFAVLFAVLIKSGPHDDLMSSAFQASLKGGLARITHGQAEEVAYGSTVTLRNTFERQCWLHSHAHTYPVKYPDGRGSSAQQQVTCYGFKDSNNWWIIKDPNRDMLQVDFPPKPVLNGDIVQIIHGSTGRALNSHDVAAPLNPANQEVSCYIDYNISMAAQNLWRVEIVNPDGSNTWKTIRSQVRFVHVNTSQAMKISGQTLPEWGFQQLEVCTDRLINQQSTIWNVEEHQQNISYPEGYDPEEHKTVTVPEASEQKAIPMPFFRKYYELQVKMLQSNKDAMNEHRFSSRPSWWPFMRMGVAFWLAKDNNSQIFCLGNPLVWWMSVLALPAYFGLLGFYLLRRRRGIHDLVEDSWNQFVFVGEVLVLGYLLHFVPYFFTERTLFIYNYLPALLLNIILLPVVIEHIYTNILPNSWSRMLLCAGCVVLCLAVLWAFKFFSPFTYGNVALSSTELQTRKWLKTWELLSHS